MNSAGHVAAEPGAVETTMQAAALRAPTSQGGLLIEPPLAEAGQVIETNRRLVDASDYDVQGRSLSELARSARRELVAAACAYTASYRDVPELPGADRVLLAGHQPEMFHPGVWIKNFALGRLAAEQQAAVVNLLIDSDTIKRCALRVPTGELGAPRAESIPFDQPSAEIPFEERSIVDRSMLGSFGQRASEAVASFVPHPLMEEYWPLVLQRAGATDNLGLCLAQARHQLEAAWGLNTLELPQSHVCQLEAFYWLTAHLLAHLPRLVEVHNTALAEYRKRHHLRSANHPVPALASEDGWLEAPYWVWTAEHPRRRQLFARQRGHQVELTDRHQLHLELPLSAEVDGSSAVGLLAELPARGIRLRTRALSTTLLARLLLGDLFLHGIGGAKYDELTDTLIARFFGLQPPQFMVVSATRRLVDVESGNVATRAREAAAELRDMRYHPERFLHLLTGGGTPEALQWAAEKQRWLDATEPSTSPRERYEGIARCNVALREVVAPLRSERTIRLEQLRREQRAAAVLGSREYAFCLHPNDDLRDFLLAFLNKNP